MLHQGLGFLATPRGQTINVNVPAGFPEVDPEDRLIPMEEINMNDVFPDLVKTQKLMPE